MGCSRHWYHSKRSPRDRVRSLLHAVEQRRSRRNTSRVQRVDGILRGMRRVMIHAGGAVAYLLTSLVIATCALADSGLEPLNEADVLDAAAEAQVDSSVADASHDISGDSPDSPEDVFIAPLPPSSIPSLEFWVRGDDVGDAGMLDGAAGDAGTPISTWPNIASSGTPRDLHASGTMPTLRVDPSYASQGVVAFSGLDGLSNSSWSLAPPFTVLLVGHTASAAQYSYFIDSAFGERVSVLAESPLADLLFYTTASNMVLPSGGVGSTTKPSCIIVSATAGGTITVYVTSDSSTAFSTSVNSINGVILGNFQGNDIIHSLSGEIAEAALFSSVLNSADIQGLNAYASSRYNITIQ